MKAALLNPVSDATNLLEVNANAFDLPRRGKVHLPVECRRAVMRLEVFLIIRPDR